MNCKPGDLAVVVMSDAGNQGKIVRCLIRHDGPWTSGSDEPGWIVDGAVMLNKNGLPKSQNCIVDRVLRPIRDSDGEDEMLRIAGKPQEVNA